MSTYIHCSDTGWVTSATITNMISSAEQCICRPCRLPTTTYGRTCEDNPRQPFLHNRPSSQVRLDIRPAMQQLDSRGRGHSHTHKYMSSTGMCHGNDPHFFCSDACLRPPFFEPDPSLRPLFLVCQSKPPPIDHVVTKKVKVIKK